MRKWVAVAVVCLIVAIAIPVGYTTWYVREYAKHSCQALAALTTGPPPSPSQRQLWKFYTGLRYWESSDGCP